MGDGFAGLLAAGAGRRVGLRDAVEVVVEWGVLSSELDEEASVASRE